MLIFENNLRIIFDDGLKHNTGIIKGHVEDIYEGIKYRVDIYENGELSDKTCYIFEHQILQVYIKDVYGHDIWAKIIDLYASYPNGTIIRPDTILKRNVGGRNSGSYRWSEYVNYMVNDKKITKAAIREWKITPKKVIFNGPATVVLWSDNTKTIVKRREGEEDDREKAVMYCILKKICGNKAGMDRYLKQFFKEVESNEEKAD